MAEILAGLGGAAAGAQLLHYGFKVLTAALALPRCIRHSPQMLQAWELQSSAMLQMLLDLKQRAVDIEPSTSILLDLCLKDAIALRSLVVPTCRQHHDLDRSRLRELWFVLRKEHEVERIIGAFNNKFSSMALHLIASLTLSVYHSEYLITYLLCARKSKQQGQPIVESRVESSNLVHNTENHEQHLSLDETIRDGLAAMSFFSPTWIPVEVLSILTASANVAHTRDALVATMCVDMASGGSLIRLDHAVRKQLRSQLIESPGGLELLTRGLNALDEVFPASFTGLSTLSVGRDMHDHVKSALTALMHFTIASSICSQAASLAFRVCAYLIADGRYTIATKFMESFGSWIQSQFPTNFCMATGLRGKACAASALQGDIENALKISTRILRSRREKFGSRDKRTLHSLNNKGLIYHAKGDYIRSAKYLSTALNEKTELYGKHHADTLTSVNNLGIVYQSQGHHELAENLFHRSLNGWLQAYGEENIHVIAARSNLAITLQYQGRFHEAKAQHRHVYKMRCHILGAKHHETVKSKANLAMTINAMGQHVAAEKLYREAIADLDASLGPSHPDVLKTHTNLATTLHDQGKYAEAESVVRKVLPLIIRKHGSMHFSTLIALEFRAILLHHMENFVTALAIATEVVKRRTELFGYHHCDTKRSVQHMKDLRLEVV
jgi:tetratricopeptide (TPR) repeat protein